MTNQLSKHPPTEDWSSLTQELIDTFPRIWTRGLLYCLMLFLAIALPWAMFSRVDETGTARGRLEPKGKTIKLDAPVAETVSAVMVKEGEAIKAGQRLLSLESEIVSTELVEQQQKLEGQQNRLTQLELLKNQLIQANRTQEQQNQAQILEKQAQIEQAQQNLKALKLAYSIQKDEKQSQIDQAKQDLAKNKIAHNLADINLKGAREKYQRYRQALEDSVISRDRYLEVEQSVKENSERLTQAQFDIIQSESRFREQQNSYERAMSQAQAEIVQSQLRLKEQEGSSESLIYSGQLALLKSQEQLKNLETEITTLTAEIAQIQSQIESLKFQLSQRVLKSPVDGIVFQLSVKNAGVVVKSGDAIAEIAPTGTILVLRAQMATTESGSLRVGMPVKMKFDAYPFQDYGIVEGKLSDISPTSKVTQTEQGQVTTFDLEIELQQTCLPTAKTCVPLTPGQTATAEVIVRQRKLIDFVLDPFKKLQKSGLDL
ncbi:HlyD family efflux transporter periplasmic adaptor subunit [Chroococcus sp. FPU101]|uniref:HlyD family efflux transporter periplasmic adaptor subunit n=1 Tax=Chroococcus sp. FPU101 TaxID=1974212 RepID=UPI001A8DD1AB|nr:HlyD family efflux transporter periplasmic adaptor subunit [Chroococcus sp. FPU101]GFE68849.1 secretion protein HlyD family protein [Chroococcus sp. FPU101]